MVDIQSKEVIDKISDELKVQPALMIPRALMEKIQLAYNINDPHIITADGMSDSPIKSTSGTLTAFSVPADKDFFLTGIGGSYIKDSTCDSATGAYTVQISVGNKIITVWNFPLITLTAQTENKTLNFNPPIKLDRGSFVQMLGAFTVGVCVRDLHVSGYLTQPQ